MIPFSSPRQRSKRMISGCSFVARATASVPLPASQTTIQFGFCSMRARRAEQTAAWSSTIRIPMPSLEPLEFTSSQPHRREPAYSSSTFGLQRNRKTCPRGFVPWTPCAPAARIRQEREFSAGAGIWKFEFVIPPFPHYAWGQPFQGHSLRSGRCLAQPVVPGARALLMEARPVRG